MTNHVAASVGRVALAAAIGLPLGIAFGILAGMAADIEEIIVDAQLIDFKNVFPDFRQLALNLGAVGDQRSEEGTPWLAYPRPFRPGALVAPMFASGPLRYERRNADDEYGILTVRDIAAEVVGANRSVARTSVYEVMTKPALTVAADMNVKYAIPSGRPSKAYAVAVQVLLRAITPKKSFMTVLRAFSEIKSL